MELAELVDEVLAAAGDEADLDEAADSVIAKVPRAARPGVLHQLMVEHIRSRIVSATSARSLTSFVHGQRSGGQPGRPRAVVLAPYMAFLAIDLQFDGKRVRLGEATIEQLRIAARRRRAMAETMNTNAAALEKIAATCEEHGVETVAELPQDVVERLADEIGPDGLRDAA